MMSLKANEIYRLCLWEEAVGKLEEIKEKDGDCVALIGKIRIAIPYELKQRLQPHLGRRITILRTDLPQKQFLVRTVACEPISGAKS